MFRTSLAFLVLALPSTAFAGMDPCEVCYELDATEEACEDLYGDGGFCEEIGTFEEECPEPPDSADEEDSGEAADTGDSTGGDCPDLCGGVDALEEECESIYGDGNEICERLGSLDEECTGEEEEDEDDEDDEDDGEECEDDDDEDDEDDDDDEDDEDDECASGGASAEADESGGCSASAAGTGSAFALLPLVAVALRRRSAPRRGRRPRTP